MRDPESPPAVERSLGDHLAESACLAALLGLPLFFLVFTDRVFEPEKAALLRWLALVAGAGVAAEAWNRRRLGRRDRPPRPAPWPARRSRDPLVLALLGLLLLELISTLGSVSPAISLMGSEARGQGLATTAALAMMALCAARIAGRPGGPTRLAAFAGASLLPSGLYGLLQARGLDPLPWEGDVVTRIAGAAGSSLMLASGLVMGLPLAGWLTLRAWRAASRRPGALAIVALATWLVTLGLGLLALAASGSRGPILGLAGGLLILGLARTIQLRRPKPALALTLTGIALAGGLLALNFGPSALDPLRELPLLDRMAIALHPDRDTTRVRLRLWEGSAAALAESPPHRWLIGHGPETMDLIWAPYYSPILAYDEPRGWVPDRAHNLVLDGLLTGGLLGLASLLTVFGLALRRAWTWMRSAPASEDHREARGFAFAAFLLLTAHLIELQTGFAITLTRLLTWVVAGALVGIGQPDHRPQPVLPPDRPEPRSPTRPSTSGLADATLGMLVTGLCLGISLLRPYLVGGGPAAVASLITISCAGVGLSIAGAHRRAPSLAAGDRALDRLPLRGPIAIALTFAAARLWLLSRGSQIGTDHLALALAGSTIFLAALFCSLLWHARSLNPTPSTAPDGRISIRASLAPALLLALALGIWPVMAPVAAGALAKEGRRVWQAPVAALRLDAQPGRAESFLHRALRRYDAARRIAPWEPAYDLAAARARVELADLLADRAARARAAEPIEPDPPTSPDAPNPPPAPNSPPAEVASPAKSASDRPSTLASAAFDAALADLDAAESKAPTSPLPAITRARTLRVRAEREVDPTLRTEGWASAREAYSIAIRAAPAWPEILDEAASTALAAGEAPSALELCHRALALDPFYRSAWRCAAAAERALGRPARAAEAYARYFEDYRNASDLLARRLQIEVLIEAGRHAEALTAALELRDLSPQDPALTELLNRLQPSPPNDSR